MKYDFALDFTPEEVRLLQGSGDDQVVFGTVAFDDAHFDTRLEDLRKEAEEVHGGPLPTALLLPKSEVLFHTMDVEEGTEITEENVRAELDGMTPYDIDALAYDWKAVSKTRVEIAAVAQETLAEADAFAASHGFGPGPYSTAPNPKAFRGQPNFGASKRPMPKPAPAPVPTPTPEPEAPAASTSPAPVADTPAPKAADTPPPATKEASGAPDTPKESPPQKVTPPATAAPARTDASGPAGPAEPKATPPAKEPEKQPLIDDLAEPQISRTSQGLQPRATQGKTGTARPQKGDAAPTAPKSDETAPPSFSSRRTDGGTAGAAGAAAAAAAGAVASAATAATASRLGSLAARVASLPDGGTGSSSTSRPEPKDTPAPKDAPRTKAGPVPPLRRTTAPAGAPGSASPTPTVRRVDTPDSVSGAAKSLSTTPGSAKPRPAFNEAESLTVFGMRGAGKPSKSSVVPILMGLAVAIVLAVGVWLAFLFLTDPENTAPAVEQSSALPAEDEAVEDVAILDDTSDLGPSLETDGAPAGTTLEESAVDQNVAPTTEPADPAAEIEPEAAPAEPEPADTAPSGPELEPGPDDPLRRSQDAPEATRYAATGVSTASPSASETPSADSTELDSGQQSDSSIRVQDGVATLDAPELAAIMAPAALTPPPPPGARFELNEDGLVVATPEGALSPQGVRITAGQPPVVPPQAPDRPTEAPETTETAAEIEESQLGVPVTNGQPTAIPPERPGLQAAIGPAPAARPDDIAVTRRAGLDDADDTAAGGVSLTSLEGPQDTSEGVAQTPSDAEVVLAALTPRARPERPEPQQDIPQISEEQSAAQAEAVAAAIASIVPGIEEAREEAVAQSLRPNTRPANLSRAAEQARAAAPVQVAAAASTVTPRNPTTGSVSSRATQQDAIRLNQVNLIGVYGTQSNRRALIRLPSGRFVKVRVGDRVDGGRVSAIGTDRLQYVKGGRQVVLSIPAG